MVSLKKIIVSASVVLPLTATEKTDIIDELLQVLVRQKCVSNQEQAHQDLLEREQKMSTGMDQGVAIPHAKTTAVKTLCTAVGISPKGVDFKSIDGNPSYIFIMTLSPKDKSGPHIEFLAQIGSILRNERTRTALVKAKTPEEVVRLLIE